MLKTDQHSKQTIAESFLTCLFFSDDCLALCFHLLWLIRPLLRKTLRATLRISCQRFTALYALSPQREEVHWEKGESTMWVDDRYVGKLD